MQKLRLPIRTSGVRRGNPGLPRLPEYKSLQTDVCLRIRLQRRRRPDRQFFVLLFMQRLQGLQLFELWPLMNNHPMRIGTRGSQLALWQARWVQRTIEEQSPKTATELVIIKTTGDKITDVPLAKVGGKGLFVKEIEEALMDGRIDLAVHSMKDMPAELPQGLCISAVPERENPLDALVANDYMTLDALPQGAHVGTSSLRRSSQLLHRRPDLNILALRGNLDTRLKKLTGGNLDAIVLATAGLKRLGLDHLITSILDAEIMLPAVGQGALCIESRTQDSRTSQIVTSLDHAETHLAVIAERAFLHRLEGGCQVPIAAFATIENQRLELTGMVAELDGGTLIKETTAGPSDQATSLGLELAEKLIARGAGAILEKLKQNA
jgi:hydroxymethylbilane synthase